MTRKEKPFEREELDRLRREDDLRSLGDRPASPPVKELRRRFELERKAAKGRKL